MTNRIIKFRAWNKKGNYMFSFNRLSIHEMNDGGFMDLQDVFNCKKWEIMQTVGLSDSQGNEIFEGDIVVGLGNDKKWTLKQKHIVVWDRGGYGFKEIKTNYTEDLRLFLRYWSDCLYRKIKVIGNIYENPELLKIKKEI